MSINVVKTGLYWVLKKDITNSQLNRLRNAYTYIHPKDIEQSFITYVETDNKIGLPTGDYDKLQFILGNINIDDRTVLPSFTNSISASNLQLREGQTKALQEALDHFNTGGTTFNLRGSPGVGKSYMLAALLAKLKVKVLIIAHLSSLITQIKNEIETATGIGVTVLNAKNHNLGDINVATSQFIAQNADVWYQIKKGIGLIVIDEAESVASPSTLRIVQKAYARYRIFISATFSRSVDKRTEALTDVAGHKKITIEAQNLLSPTIIQVYCPEVFDPPINKNLYQRAKGRFFKQKSIRNKVIDITLASLQKNRQVLIATDIVEMQEELKATLESQGIKCGIMNGTTSAKEREAILNLYNTGEIQVILGFNVLNAGLSIPRISTIIKVSIPSSVEKLEQLIGRGRRMFDGKSGFWFIDLVWSGFKDQCGFYHSKVKQEGWKYNATSWDKFLLKLKGG